MQFATLNFIRCNLLILRSAFDGVRLGVVLNWLAVFSQVVSLIDVNDNAIAN